MNDFIEYLEREGASARMLRVLRGLNISSSNELDEVTEKQVRSFPHVGKSTWEEIQIARGGKVLNHDLPDQHRDFTDKRTWTKEGRNIYVAGKPFVRIELTGASPTEGDNFVLTMVALLNGTLKK